MQKKRTTSNGGSALKRRNVSVGPKEKKRLIQLGLCIFLFVAVFVGRSSELAAANEAGERLMHLIRNDTDFADVFSDLGKSVSEGESVWTSLKNTAQALFGVPEGKNQNEKFLIVTDEPAGNRAQEILVDQPTQESVLPFGEQNTQKEEPADLHKEETASNHLKEEETEEPKQADQEEPAAAEPEIPEYSGPELPANATMEYYELELSEVITPVLGEIASQYGYRIHPLSGEYAFHSGVDIAADKGTPIKAFADGVVEFIGESDAYGLYVQLDHGDGTKSFYCHCSELLLGKGKAVEAGQTIALVGDTGDTTGSHLHFELKKDDVLLNPIYYIGSVNRGT